MAIKAAIQKILGLVVMQSSKPVSYCPRCKQNLWLMEVEGQQSRLVTLEGRQHYKTRCNIRAR